MKQEDGRGKKGGKSKRREEELKRGRWRYCRTGIVKVEAPEATSSQHDNQFSNTSGVQTT